MALQLPLTVNGRKSDRLPTIIRVSDKGTLFFFHRLFKTKPPLTTTATPLFIDRPARFARGFGCPRRFACFVSRLFIGAPHSPSALAFVLSWRATRRIFAPKPPLTPTPTPLMAAWPRCQAIALHTSGARRRLRASCRRCRADARHLRHFDLRSPALPPPRSQPPAHSALSTGSRDAFSDPLARSARFQGWPLPL